MQPQTNRTARTMVDPTICAIRMRAVVREAVASPLCTTGDPPPPPELVVVVVMAPAATCGNPLPPTVPKYRVVGLFKRTQSTARRMHANTGRMIM